MSLHVRLTMLLIPVSQHVGFFIKHDFLLHHILICFTLYICSFTYYLIYVFFIFFGNLTFDKVTWHLTQDTWQLTPDTWHMTHNTWHGTHSKWWTFFPYWRSWALTIWKKCFREFSERISRSASEFMNECQTCLEESHGLTRLTQKQFTKR